MILNFLRLNLDETLYNHYWSILIESACHIIYPLVNANSSGFYTLKLYEAQPWRTTITNDSFKSITTDGCDTHEPWRKPILAPKVRSNSAISHVPRGVWAPANNRFDTSFHCSAASATCCMLFSVFRGVASCNLLAR